MRENQTCLIVDDMPNVRLVAREMLSNLGFGTVLEAATAEEALGLLSEHAVDVVLLDWYLPRMSGLDCLRAIRSNASHAQVQVVMITADRQVGHVREAIAAGAAGYVVKPFSMQTLGAHLDLALSDRNKETHGRTTG